MEIEGGFWTNDPRGKHEQRYWDGHTWTSYVSDLGFTARDPLPGGSDSYPPPGTAPDALLAPQPRASAAHPVTPPQRVLGLPGHTVATLVTGGGWLLLWPAISLWRRGARPLAASWTVTMALVLVATTMVIGRIPDTSTIVEATAFAEDHAEVPTGPLPSNDSAPTLVAAADEVAAGQEGSTVGPGPTDRPTLRGDGPAAAALPGLPSASPTSATPTAATTATPTPTATETSATPVPSSAEPTSTATTSVPTPTAPGPTGYPDCAALLADHSRGVGRAAAVDATSGIPSSAFLVDEELYAANSALDTDQDGIACE